MQGKRKSKIGQVFGKWTVIDFGRSSRHWKCRCECGFENDVASNALTSGRTKSCVPCSNKLKTIQRTGRRYGRLVVLNLGNRTGHGKTFWLCKCDCGEEIEVWAGTIEKQKSCGCIISEKTIQRNHRHGFAKGKKSVEYITWLSMHQRCRGTTTKTSLKYYYDRGIQVCKRWHKFENFFQDMGYRPKGKSLDRIDNDKGYSKNNCRWATALEQGQNRRCVKNKHTE